MYYICIEKLKEQELNIELTFDLYCSIIENEELKEENKELKEELKLKNEKLNNLNSIIEKALEAVDNLKRYNVKQEVRMVDGVTKHYNVDYLDKNGKYVLAKDVI